MIEKEYFDELANSIVAFDFRNIKELIQKALHTGIPAYKIVMEGLAKGMDIVGEKYQKGEYFLAELAMAGETMKRAMDVLTPVLKDERATPKGKVVIGTVEGDIHDIGKNLVATFLTSAGFEVYDLSVDVPAGKFVGKIMETNATLLCLSALLTVTIPEMKKVIDALKQANLRDKVKVVVGGAVINEDVAKEVGADLYGGDAAHGVKLIVERYFSS